MMLEDSIAVVEGMIDELFEARRDTFNRLIRYVELCKILDRLRGMSHTEFEYIESFMVRWAENR